MNFDGENESDQESSRITGKSRVYEAQKKVNWVIIVLNVLLFALFFSLIIYQPSDKILDNLPLEIRMIRSDTDIKTDLPKTPSDPTLENKTGTDIKVPSDNTSYEEHMMVDFVPAVPFSDQRKIWLTPVYQSHRNERYLCQMLKSNSCKSYFIAESIDLFWLIAPIYSYNAETDVLIFQKHLLFKSYAESVGLHLITIEAIRDPNQNVSSLYGNSKEAKKFLCTKPDNEPYDIQVYYHNVSYIRENLLNVAIRKLDKLAPWEYAAWVDAHQFFDNPYWWEESIYKAEKYGTVQMFINLHVLHPNNQTWWSTESIIHRSLYTSSYLDVSQIAYGNAFVISRHNYYAIGYIYDECIATCCDCAYVLGTFPPEITWDYKYKNYFETFKPWINNTRNALKYSRSYIRGDLFHFFHGKWFPYLLLMDAIENSGFNPARDIRRDENFSIIITNQQISAAQERIIFDSKN